MSSTTVATVLAHPPRVGGDASEVVLRAWRPGDERLVAADEAAFSAASLTSRFFTGMSHLPRPYLERLAHPAPGWDAVVAVDHGHLVGWAELGRPAGCPDEAELGVLVADAWQRRGIGRRLIREVIARAVRRGVRRLCIDVLATNEPALAGVRTMFPAATMTVDAGTIEFTVEMPGVVRDSDERRCSA